MVFASTPDDVTEEPTDSTSGTGHQPCSPHATARCIECNGSGECDNTAPYRHLMLLARIAKLLALSDQTEDALRQVLAWMRADAGLMRGVIALTNEAGDELSADITATGISPEVSDKMRYRTGEGITGQVLATGMSITLTSLANTSNFLDRSGLRRGLELEHLAFFCVPILWRDRVIGSLSCDKDNRHLMAGGGDLALLTEIAQLVAPFVQRLRLEDQLECYRRLHASDNGRMLGRSKAMEAVQRLVAKVAATATTVLITGETGTGKGVAAALIHELSPRHDQPFVDVNCGAIPENLVESELFGHEKGAFTGATARRMGVMERARNGTVFLDEVGELPLSAQTKLLRVLQTHQFERVGGSDTLTCRARVVAATNRDLEAAVKAGTFRADLYYRLSVFPIAMPPLRERGKADIMLLVDHFTGHFARESDKEIFRLDTPAIDMLTAYHWPGNVRELENVIERAVVLADGDVIHGHHLPPSLQHNRYAPKTRDGEEAGDFQTRLANFEIGLITEALKDSNGNQTKAADKLGMTKRMIQYKITQYGIDWQRFK
jgi:Nif-specific regulatory protein